MTKTNVSISVVIPVYNCEKTIKETIDSVLAQRNVEFEVIIVDDGSTDKSAEIISAYSDTRIRYFYKKNGGISSALNYGISKSNAGIIARIDGDDVALPDRFRKQYDILSNDTRICLVGTAVDYINSKSEIIGRTFPYILPVNVPNILLRQNLFSHPSVMFRKNIFLIAGGYPEELSGICEDYYLWSRMLKFGEAINLSESLTQYRISEGQITDWAPSEEYYSLIKRIISSDSINSDILCQLKKTKEKDKKLNNDNVITIKNKREEIIKKNIFNKIYRFFLSYRISKRYVGRFVCLIKSFIILFRYSLHK